MTISNNLQHQCLQLTFHSTLWSLIIRELVQQNQAPETPEENQMTKITKGKLAAGHLRVGCFPDQSTRHMICEEITKLEDMDDQIHAENNKLCNQSMGLWKQIDEKRGLRSPLFTEMNDAAMLLIAKLTRPSRKSRCWKALYILWDKLGKFGKMLGALSYCHSVGQPSALSWYHTNVGL